MSHAHPCIHAMCLTYVTDMHTHFTDLHTHITCSMLRACSTYMFTPACAVQTLRLLLPQAVLEGFFPQAVPSSTQHLWPAQSQAAQRGERILEPGFLQGEPLSLRGPPTSFSEKSADLQNPCSGDFPSLLIAPGRGSPEKRVWGPLCSAALDSACVTGYTFIGCFLPLCSHSTAPPPVGRYGSACGCE